MQFYSDSFYYEVKLHQSDKELPYLFMLHGFMGSSAAFDHLMNELKSFCNPITIDLAGHGKTKSPSDPEFYTTERQVKQITSIVSRLKFDQLIIYGYSMGGRLAFQLLAEDSHLFSGAVIESSHCGIESESEKLSRQKTDDERARQIESDFESFIMEWNKLPLFQHTPASLRSVYESIMKEQNPDNMAASLRGFGAGVMPSVCNQIQNLDLSLQFVTGALDQKYVDIMTGLENKFGSARVHIIEGAGHRVHTDQPKELIHILKETFSKI